MLEQHEQQALLALARVAILARLEDRPLAAGDVPLARGGLAWRTGAFVTLTRQGRLRGCIGSVARDESLVETVEQLPHWGLRRIANGTPPLGGIGTDAGGGVHRGNSSSLAPYTPPSPGRPFASVLGGGPLVEALRAQPTFVELELLALIQIERDLPQFLGPGAAPFVAQRLHHQRVRIELKPAAAQVGQRVDDLRSLALVD